MKFVKVFALLFVFSTIARAQEDFIDEVQSPNHDGAEGLFDEDLEPLNETEVVRPENQNPANAETPNQNAGTPGINFPEPKKVTSTRSSGKALANLPASMDIPNKNEKVRMDFVQVEIEDVVKYFAERLQKKFIYDPTILSGKVTIISPTEVTMQEAYGAFLSSMEVRGYVIYPAGAYFKIEKAANARKVPLPVYEGPTPNDDSFVTRIITLKFLLVRDISQAVRNLLSRTGGDLIEHAPTNTLIISDYAYSIRRIVRILDILDVESFQEQVEILPLRYAAAPDVARKITDFFPAGGGSGAPGATPPATRLSRRGGGTTDSGVIQKVVADERTNSIIILGSERGIEQVKKFIARIDLPTEGGGGQIHVYPVQNVKAEELSTTLSSLATGNKNKTGVSSMSTSLLPPVPGAAPASGADSQVANLGDVKITADKATNALVIQSSPRDFEVLKTIIKKLDIRRRQVFLEGAILEANITKGFNWNPSATGPFARTDALKGSDGTKSGAVGSLNGLGFDSFLKNAITNPSALTGMALGFRSGATYGVNYTDANGNAATTRLPFLSAVISLSARNGNVNILSTPHILATANEEATLSIGNEVPQNAGSTLTSTGTSQANIVRLKIATEINITPQINQGDYLTLKIKQKINDVGGDADANGNLPTVNREASTTVIVKDQQTVVIGGLMRDKITDTMTKVPLLGDIPILGWLFKSKTSSSEKVNLLLFLTPYIIKNTGDMNDQFFRKLKEREGFLNELGVKEKQGVPSSGLTEEQIKMLDKEYVKSLQKKFVHPRDATNNEVENLNPDAKESSNDVKSPSDASGTPTPVEVYAPSDVSAPVEIAPSTPAPAFATPAPEVNIPAMPIPEAKPEEMKFLTPAIQPIAPPIEQKPVEIPAPALPTIPVPQTQVAPAEPLKQNETPSKQWILEDSPPEKAR